MVATAFFVLVTACALVGLHPYPIWSNYWIVLTGIVKSRSLTRRQKQVLLRSLMKDGLIAAALTVPYWMDRALFAGRWDQPVRNPVFIIGQPRSGTTFLHRTLSDSGAFLSLPHFYWRFPFICVWWVVDRLGLYETVAKLRYWPDNDAGLKADRIHRHRMGDFEEHGIFLEERLFHHYFLFRKYPVPEIFDRIATFDHLSRLSRERMARHVVEVVNKFAWYKGSDRPWLTKENESIDIYRALIDMNPGARIVFLVRAPSASLPSYLTLSIVSTLAKTGIDPRDLAGWNGINTRFRLIETERMIMLSEELADRPRVARASYDHLVSDICGTISDLDERLELRLEPSYFRDLERVQEHQKTRQAGYRNDPCDASDFHFYAQFVKGIEENHMARDVPGG